MTANSDALVNVNWLAERIGDANLKILDCSWYLPQEKRDPFVEYKNAHIPSAIFLEWEACSGEESTQTAFYLPTSEQFRIYTASLGISADDFVVAYDAEGIHSIAARAWWMFRVFGHTNVALLDGGMRAWKQAGLQVEARILSIVPVERTPVRYNRKLMRNHNQMRANLKTAAEQIIDLRARGRYLGTAVSHEKRPGRIPGAINLPVGDCIDKDDHTLLSMVEMRSLIKEAGIDLNKPTVAYCGGGGSSPVFAFGAYLLGYPDVAIYDGAYEDWSNHLDAPIKRGE